MQDSAFKMSIAVREKKASDDEHFFLASIKKITFVGIGYNLIVNSAGSNEINQFC